MPAAPPSSPGKNGHVTSRPSMTPDTDIAPAAPLDLARSATEPAEVQRAKSAQASPHWRPRAAAGGRSSSNTVSPLLTWQPEPSARPGLPPGIATPGQPTPWMGKSPLLRAVDPMQGDVPGAPGLEGDLVGAPGLELSQPFLAPADSAAEAPSAVLAAAVERAAAARASLAEGSGGIKEEEEEGEGDYDGGDFEQLEGLDEDAVAHVGTSGALASPLMPGTPLDGTPLLGPVAPAGRPRWASMTEEEMRKLPGASPILGPSPAHRPCAVPATPSPHLAPNPRWPTGQPVANWLLPSAQQEQGFVPARKRWASVSDDETTSPMLWPTRSPLQRPRGKGGGAGPAGAAPGRRQGGNQQAFLLPQAHPGMQPMQPVMVPGDGTVADMWQPFPVGPGPGAEASVEAQQAAWAAAAMRYWPSGGWGGCGAPFAGMPWAGMCDAGGYFGAGYGCGCGFTPTDAEAGADRVAQTGYTVLWVGEAAFRASPSKKEQITKLGYDVRIYRSHDKCTKALSKKNNLSQGQTTFVVSEADASPILEYLRSREVMNLNVIVDMEEKQDTTEAEKLKSHPGAETNYLAISHAWSDVLDVLRTIASVAENFTVQQGPVGPMLAAAAAAAHASASQGATSSAAPASGLLDHSRPLDLDPLRSNPRGRGSGAGGAVGSTAVLTAGGAEASAASAAAANNVAGSSDTPWTLVWVSDQAFKPAAAALKAKLEAMGCQVKGYKTHKNAARALDKKRVLVRTIVLLSGAEAPAFTTYLANRPELAGTPVVVESNSRAAPVKPTATVKVADSFDEAVDL
eukprot:CAMPEP_0206602298 /NCGR_PEP_ID=MMETSP0325_2-20121206/47297_1 /ASSEMBLY_ACC=CAM_ASM_000347 /TAXON_ID=2866 /ORGANISM="Crypthecodinium cohnii, Strain Seligo" /LENGTH=796 /DNA_ID=CAMNT_0054114745 /DNA_START=213 /DNA_END=2600 /DNA_ORIENTATION=+